MVRVKYDLLPEGKHTVVYVDGDPAELDPVDRMVPAAGVEEVKHGDVLEVEDLNDPKSRRARGVRQHLEGIGKPGQSGHQPPLCSLLEEKPSKKGASSAAAESAGVTGPKK
jgi:hypothetical protein